MVLEMTQAENAERVATGPPEARTPVILKPAKPEEPKYVPPTAKPAAKAPSESSGSKKEEKTPTEPTRQTDVKEEGSSAPDPKTKMTYQVKAVPKPKTEEVKSEPASASTAAPTAANAAEANPTTMTDPVDPAADANRDDNTGDLWGNYVGTGQPETGPVSSQQQTVNIGGHRTFLRLKAQEEGVEKDPKM